MGAAAQRQRAHPAAILSPRSAGAEERSDGVFQVGDGGPEAVAATPWNTLEAGQGQEICVDLTAEWQGSSPSPWPPPHPPHYPTHDHSASLGRHQWCGHDWLKETGLMIGCGKKPFLFLNLDQWKPFLFLFSDSYFKKKKKNLRLRCMASQEALRALVLYLGHS